MAVVAFMQSVTRIDPRNNPTDEFVVGLQLEVVFVFMDSSTGRIEPLSAVAQLGLNDNTAQIRSALTSAAAVAGAANGYVIPSGQTYVFDFNRV